MQRWKQAAILVCLFLAMLAITLAHGDTITKGLIGEQDLNLTQTDNAAKETYSRATSTGSTMLLYKITGGSFAWDNSYTRIIRPKSVLGNSTGVISGYDNVTATSGLYSVLLSLTGNASVGGTLGVTGAATFSSTGAFTGALSAASLSTGAGTFSSDVNANGNIVGDAATIVSGMARYVVDGVIIDTGTAAPTSGTWTAGSVVLNSAATTRGTIAATAARGWVCVAAGTPGTWETIWPTFTVAPASAAAYGAAGMTALAAGYWHTCVSDNTWQRVATATW